MKEELVLINQDESLNADVQNSNNKNKLIVASVIIIVSLFSLFFYWDRQINSKLSLAMDEINTLKTEKEKDNFSFDIKLLNVNSFVNRFQHDVEGGVATDDFIVEKITLTTIPIFTNKPSDKGFLRSTIDLSTQPNGKSGYTGQGKFTATDRELKSMILDVLAKVKLEYGPTKDNPNKLPNWDDGIHYVTIKNYEIGTYENGIFKLKGE